MHYHLLTFDYLYIKLVLYIEQVNLDRLINFKKSNHIFIEEIKL
jgi:hypothetical protein